MDHRERSYDVALSFAGEDRTFVELVAKHLKERNVRVFYDKDEEVYLWGKDMGDALDSVYRLHSNVVVIFISAHYARKMWTNHERQSAFARAIEERREYVLPARFDDTELTGLRPTIAYVDLRHETPESFAKKLIQKLEAIQPQRTKTAEKESVANIKTGLLDSLRLRLARDFHTSGPRTGQFGKTRIEGETQFYRESIGEIIKVKPHYYMTYWGWKLMPILLPDLVTEWTLLTVHALKDQFAGRRWIQVELENYEGGPIAPNLGVDTLRHTVKAAEILLLLETTGIPSLVAWNLISEFENFSIGGCWKEFLTIESKPSLWSSAYVFRFLTKIEERRCDPAVPGEVNNFIAKSTPIIQETENCLAANWYSDKWKFNRLPWEVNAPQLLIECVMFMSNEELLKEVFDNLRNLLTPAGPLMNPDIGAKFKAPEYVMSTRLAYALKLYCILKGYSDTRVDNLVGWVLDNYSDQHVLDTCDIAFLYGLLHSTADIAY
jgi:hypothetical protein